MMQLHGWDPSPLPLRGFAEGWAKLRECKEHSEVGGGLSGDACGVGMGLGSLGERRASLGIPAVGSGWYFQDSWLLLSH